MTERLVMRKCSTTGRGPVRLGCVDPETDPGWGSPFSAVLFGLLPGLSVRRFKKQAAVGHGLIALRGIYLSFVIALGMIGVVVGILETTEGIGSTDVLPVAVVVVAAVGLATLAAPLLLIRPLPCESESALAEGYRQRFFLQVAFAEAAALVGFIGFIVSGAGWLYPVGALFSAIGFARLAPTSGHLRQDQDLRHRGCDVSLMSALRGLGRSQ